MAWLQALFLMAEPQKKYGEIPVFMANLGEKSLPFPCKNSWLPSARHPVSKQQLCSILLHAEEPCLFSFPKIKRNNVMSQIAIWRFSGGTPKSSKSLKSFK